MKNDIEKEVALLLELKAAYKEIAKKDYAYDEVILSKTSFKLLCFIQYQIFEIIIQSSSTSSSREKGKERGS